MITEAEKAANGSCGCRAVRVRSGAVGRIHNTSDDFVTEREEVYAWAGYGHGSAVMVFVPLVENVWFDLTDIVEVDQ